MNPFEFTTPASTEEACASLKEYGSTARIIAGGTDLLIELRRDSSKGPKVLVDISRIPALHQIRVSEGTLSIGPLVTHSELQFSGAVQRSASLLSAAAAAVGAPQIRNRGTIGGNIMNAATCADTVPPLIALGAVVVLKSSRGTRDVGLGDLFLKPYQTKAQPDEILTEIKFPGLPADAGAAFVKLGRRNALSISRLSVAAVIQRDSQNRIADARIVPGAAFPTWQRITPAEQMLVGEQPSDALFEAAGRKVSEEMIRCSGRRWSTEYKEPVLAVLVRRALMQCVSPAIQTGRSHDGSDGRSGAQATTVTFRSHHRYCTLSVIVNGRSRTATVPTNRTLLALLREDLGLTGTKCGCEIGECGACTVLLDGQPVNSCLVLAPQVHGRSVTTVEGLTREGKLHPLQLSFMENDAAHCGFCTPGMLMSAKALIDENPAPTETDIRTAISGNLCRCTGYKQIVQAIQTAGDGSASP